MVLLSSPCSALCRRAGRHCAGRQRCLLEMEDTKLSGGPGGKFASSSTHAPGLRYPATDQAPPPRSSLLLAGHLEALEAGASAEGFLDRLLGTNCFNAAVGEISTDCRRMEQEAKTRLALRQASSVDVATRCQS